MKNEIKYKIILASRSLRRKEILQNAGIKFFIISKDRDENFPKNLPIKKVPLFLARKKAIAVFDKIKNDEIILAADTIVCIDKKIIGKPKGYKDAVQILKLLSGKRHRVITGVCLLTKKKETVFSVITEVYFKKLTDEQIHFYLKKFKPFDKAGAYAIQEWIGLVGIEKINGDYFNVVGLPISRVIEELEKF